MKKILLEIFSFYTCVPKIPIMWCMAPKIWSETKYFVIWGHFLLPYPRNDLKNQNFETMKKMPGDIILLHICTINEDHMIYGSWNIRCNRQNFLLFWAIFFCPFTPLTTQKIKTLKNWKKYLEILSFYTCVP